MRDALVDLKRRAHRAQSIAATARHSIGSDHVHTARKLLDDVRDELRAIEAVAGELLAAESAAL